MPRKSTMLVYVGALLALLLGSLSPVPTRAQTARQPVIIIPGVAGSEFTASAAFRLSVNNGHGGTYTHDYKAGEKVWVNTWEAIATGDDDYFDALKLQADGTTPVAPSLYVSNVYESVYADIIDYLQDRGYVLNRDLWVFPFDWRRDIRTVTGQLDTLVQRALTASGATRADIVAHSMGGMVARSYVSDPARANRIDQLITLGSPQLGSVELLKTLLYGDTFGPSFLGIGLNPDEIKDIVQNMPGAVQLLPSEPYYTYYDNSDSTRLRPYVEDYDFDGNGSAGGVLSYAGVSQLLLNTGRNSVVMSNADSYHRGIDGQRNGGVNGVRWAALVGYGESTLGQMREYTGSCWSWFSYKPCPQREELPVEGDGTVSLMSAAMGDPYRSTLINSGAYLWYVEREHTAMVQRDSTLGITTGDGPVLPWIWGLLNGSIPMEGPARAAATSAEEAELLRAASAVTRAPQRKLQGLWLSAIGQVALQVEGNGQAVGRAAGERDARRGQLPDVRYERLPGAEFAFAKREQRRAFQIGAEQEGSVDIKLRVLADGKIEQTATFLGVYLSAKGSARLETPAGKGALTARSLPALQVDADGDGVYEQTVQASALLDAAASADTAAPTLSLRAPAQSKAGTVTPSWLAEDGQAGLLRDQGQVLDGSGKARTVKNGQPLKLPPGQYTLSVLVQDRAGNTAARSVPFSVR